MGFTIKQIYGSVQIKGKVQRVRLAFVRVRWEGKKWGFGSERQASNGAEEGAADNCHFYRFRSLILGEWSG